MIFLLWLFSFFHMLVCLGLIGIAYDQGNLESALEYSAMLLLNLIILTIGGLIYRDMK